MLILDVNNEDINHKNARMKSQTTLQHQQLTSEQQKGTDWLDDFAKSC